MKKGFVALVGAGPGDLGLLTLRGKELIEQAQVVVYDRLVSKEILQLIHPSAKAINVGKQSSNHLMAQQDINQLLLQEALAGNVVVRLKGGDPFVFGRGGEELELLARHQVAFEVVPGITSAIGAAAYAGIPVTHRDFCSSLHIITGHQKENEPLAIQFDALVQTGGTLVFLMGVASLGQIVTGLLSAGMESHMPAAIVENGTRPNQRKVVGTLADICRLAQDYQMKSPSIIIVGKVCQLSEKYDWFSCKPLLGLPVVVTRPYERESKLSKKLRDLGAQVLDAPCIAIQKVERKEPLHRFIKDLSQYTWLVFTSQNGVDYFIQYLLEQQVDFRRLSGLKIAALGSQTARALQNYGFLADYVPTVYNGVELARGLYARLKPQDNLCLLRASQGSMEMIEELQSKEVHFTDVPVYDTQLIDSYRPELKELLKERPNCIVTFTSASTVDGFISAVKGIDITGVLGVCIGEQTAKQAKEHGITHVTADKATIDSVVDKVLEVYQNGH